jgi:hypothetical protein
MARLGDLDPGSRALRDRSRARLDRVSKVSDLRRRQVAQLEAAAYQVRNDVRNIGRDGQAADRAYLSARLSRTIRSLRSRDGRGRETRPADRLWASCRHGWRTIQRAPQRLPLAVVGTGRAVARLTWLHNTPATVRSRRPGTPEIVTLSERINLSAHNRTPTSNGEIWTSSAGQLVTVAALRVARGSYGRRSRGSYQSSVAR